MSYIIRGVIGLVGLFLLAACGADPVQTRAQSDAADIITAADPPAFERFAGQSDVLELARTIAGLSSLIDPEEAARAAELSYSYTAQLREEYEIVDPWRKGGVLTWMRVVDDKRYKWRPRAEVLAYYRARDGR